MSGVASVSSVASPSRTAAVYQLNSTSFAQAISASRSVQSAKNISAAKSTPSTQATAAPTTSNLPLGVLLSVAQPSSSNALATSDYHLLRNALEAGNLAAAQQAYLRLQSDLIFAQSTQSEASPGTSLSATA